MCENPQNIIRSWNVQTAFSGGPVTYNKLVPPKYGRIMYNYVQTWREVNAGLGDLDWGAEYFSFYLPKGIRILGAMYLRIQLPSGFLFVFSTRGKYPQNFRALRARFLKYK